LRPSASRRVGAASAGVQHAEVETGVASVNESAVTGESAPVIREAGGDRSAVTGGTRILLVDDDAGLRGELRQLLEDAGYDVVAEAADGLQGIVCARRERPEVVISDLRMPGLGGLELAAELQGEFPVIILSAYDDARRVLWLRTEPLICRGVQVRKRCYRRRRRVALRSGVLAPETAARHAYTVHEAWDGSAPWCICVSLSIR